MRGAVHTHTATLVHGLTYTVLSPNSGVETVFRKGKGIPISAEMKRRLEAEALAEVTVDEGRRGKSYRAVCRFTFEPITQTV